jgi:hypothetical protein
LISEDMQKSDLVDISGVFSYPFQLELFDIYECLF